jgi:hypothetical protein
MLTLKLLHLLLLVYWLGADAGTFYASRFVADPRYTPAQRLVAAKIMLGIDVAPRLAMPLTLATGAHLAALLGLLPLGAWGLSVDSFVVAVWLLCLAWLGLVVLIHHFSNHGGAPTLTRVDFAFRVLMIAGLAAVALAPALLGWPGLQVWLAMKVLAFAGTIFCGLMIRIHLKPFGPAFAQLMQGDTSEAVNRRIAHSIQRCVPFVWLIWLLLVLCAALGLHLIG